MVKIQLFAFLCFYFFIQEMSTAFILEDTENLNSKEPQEMQSKYISKNSDYEMEIWPVNVSKDTEYLETRGTKKPNKKESHKPVGAPLIEKAMKVGNAAMSASVKVASKSKQLISKLEGPKKTVSKKKHK